MCFAVCFASGLAACGGGSGGGGGADSTLYPVPEHAKVDAKTLSAHYEKLTLDMKKEDVEKTMGEPGVPSKDKDHSPGTLVWMPAETTEWVVVSFGDDGTVSSKATNIGQDSNYKEQACDKAAAEKITATSDAGKTNMDENALKYKYNEVKLGMTKEALEGLFGGAGKEEVAPESSLYPGANRAVFFMKDHSESMADSGYCYFVFADVDGKVIVSGKSCTFTD